MSKLKKIERAARRDDGPPAHDDPRDELKRLVLEHKALTKAAVAVDNMARDKENRTTGEAIKCRLPEDAQVELRIAAKSQRDKASRLEAAMLRQLKLIPVYKLFLGRVYGIGPIVAAYLVSEINITIANNPSQLRRYCGLAVIDGHLERPTKGEKLHYNAEMRTRLYQAFSAMWKNAAKNGKWVPEDKIPDGVDPKSLESRENKKTGRWQYKIVSEDSPLGVTSKYLRIWTDYKFRMSHSARLIGQNAPGDFANTKIVNGQGKEVSARGFAHSTGWHKAADIFLFDLHLVWRSSEGLSVRCPYTQEKLKYEHAGVPTWEGPKLISVEDALEIVGDVGAQPLMAVAAE